MEEEILRNTVEIDPYPSPVVWPSFGNKKSQPIGGDKMDAEPGTIRNLEKFLTKKSELNFPAPTYFQVLRSYKNYET